VQECKDDCQLLAIVGDYYFCDSLVCGGPSAGCSTKIEKNLQLAAILGIFCARLKARNQISKKVESMTGSDSEVQPCPVLRFPHIR
jgi:hypothetical protein